MWHWLFFLYEGNASSLSKQNNNNKLNLQNTMGLPKGGSLKGGFI